MAYSPPSGDNVILWFSGDVSAIPSGDNVILWFGDLTGNVLNGQESGETLTGAAVNSIHASDSDTEAGDSTSSGAKVAENAALAVLELGDSLSSGGADERFGTLAATEAGDAGTAAATVAIAAAFAKTELGDTLLAYSLDLANLSGTELGDTLAGAAVARIRATLTKTEVGESFTATAKHVRIGNLSKTEVGDDLDGKGKNKKTHKFSEASFTPIEAGDRLTASAIGVRRNAALTKTEAGDRLTASSHHSIDARMTEHADALTAAAKAALRASFAKSENGDATAAFATTINRGAALNSGETGDDLEGSDHVLIDARMTEEAEPELLSADATANINATYDEDEFGEFLLAAASGELVADAAIAEAGDRVTGSVFIAIDAIAVELGDSLIASVPFFTDSTINEAGDTAAGAGSGELVSAATSNEFGDDIVAEAQAIIAAAMDFAEDLELLVSDLIHRLQSSAVLCVEDAAAVDLEVSDELLPDASVVVADELCPLASLTVADAAALSLTVTDELVDFGTLETEDETSECAA